MITVLLHTFLKRKKNTFRYQHKNVKKKLFKSGILIIDILETCFGNILDEKKLLVSHRSIQRETDFLIF